MALTEEGGENVSAVSEAPSAASNSFNPFDTTALHTFIRGAFAGAVLLEEHRVRLLLSVVFVQ